MFKLLGLGQAPSAPALDPTDEVSPIHWFDGGYSMRSLVVYVFMAFDDVLDPEKIQDAFGRVVARGGYRKLGARLRKNVISTPPC